MDALDLSDDDDDDDDVEEDDDDVDEGEDEDDEDDDAGGDSEGDDDLAPLPRAGGKQLPGKAGLQAHKQVAGQQGSKKKAGSAFAAAVDSDEEGSAAVAKGRQAKRQKMRDAPAKVLVGGKGKGKLKGAQSSPFASFEEYSHMMDDE
eukprot:TRINITY_DN66292_c0_g1_i1.p3 TRINITY_DN66292_c0_g1~~TRINITY_DN66292_c0_g1_i1.p3  ORF type:complete len:156 (+),score=44.16 TRINITY_DN66292_c0_g1_i1:30-470(+)